jgi:signal transduction histidine kinase
VELIGLVSIGTRLAAMGWALVLVRRLRLPSLVYFAVLIAVVSGKEIYHQWAGARDPVDATLALVLSIGCLGAVAFAGRVLTERRERVTRPAPVDLRRLRAVEMVETIAGGLAHDFNNMLAAIHGYTQLTIARLPADSAARRDLEEVLWAASRARNLAGRIVRFDGSGGKERQVIDLAAVVADTLRLVRPVIPPTIQICRRLDTAGSIVADATGIQQVVLNLCLNAADAMGSSGGRLEVAVEAATPEDGPRAATAAPAARAYLRLTVRDTGRGIDPAILGRIFEPRFTTKRPGPGTGLGLHVVQRIVAEHDGVLRVESVPEQGATFHVFFPRAESAQPVIPVTRLTTWEGTPATTRADPVVALGTALPAGLAEPQAT